MLDFKALASALFESHGVILWQYDSQTEQYRALATPERRFSDFLQTQEALAHWESKCRSRGDPHLLIVQPDIWWFGFSLEGVTLLAGPTLISGSHKEKLLQSIAERPCDAAAQLYVRLPVLPYLELMRLYRFLYIYITGLYPDRFEMERSDISKGLRFYFSDEEAYHNQERDYTASRKIEKMVRDWVRNGDVEAAMSTSLPLVPTSGELSENELRSEKNLFIVYVSVLSRAAIDGGLPYEISFPVSDMYIRQCEAIDNISELRQLNRTAMLDYAARVRNYKGSTAYSEIVNRCRGYIIANLSEPLTIRQVAAALKINAEHLARKFRKETGTALTDYIHEVKIEEAKKLLAYTEYELAAIAVKVGYSSQSQFSTAFKKKTGVTPKYYREHSR